MLIKLCVLCPIHLISNTPKWSQICVNLHPPRFLDGAGHHLFMVPGVHWGAMEKSVLLVNEAAGINHRTWLTSYLLSCPSGERSSKACHFPLEFESPIVNQLSITLKDVILSYDPCNRTHNSHQLAAGAAFFCCTWGPVLAGSRFFWGNQLRFFSLA